MEEYFFFNRSFSVIPVGGNSSALKSSEKVVLGKGKEGASLPTELSWGGSAPQQPTEPHEGGFLHCLP